MLFATPGVAAIRERSPASMVLESSVDTPFCATVKSALPIEMIAAADCSSPLLVTARVTTVITANATAAAIPIALPFLETAFLNAKSRYGTTLAD